MMQLSTLSGLACSLGRSLLLTIALAGGHALFAQIGVRLVQFRPTGDLGMTMEKKTSAELLYIEEFEDKWRTRASIGFFKLQPRLPVFPTTGYLYDPGLTVEPGTESFSKWNMFFFSAGADFAPVQLMDDKLKFYIGLDITCGTISATYETHTPGIADTGFDGGYLMAGLRGRVGAEYAFSDHVGAFLETCRSYYLVEETGGLNHNEIGLGFRYTFN